MIAATMQAGVVGAGGDDDSGFGRRQPQRAGPAACRSAALRRRPRAAVGADRQGRRQRRQDSEAAQRGGDGAIRAPARRRFGVATSSAKCACRRTPTGVRCRSCRTTSTRPAAKLNLPPGYDIVAGGDTEELEIMFRNMFQALMLAVVFIYLILASQFGSFTHPLAIMLSLPLSLVGVAVMLYFTQRHAEHHEHDRPHHADGPRHEERDPARGLHEPGAGARGCRGTRRCCRRAPRACGRSS